MKLSVEQLRAIVKGKEIYIWGAMIVGQGICRALLRHNMIPTSFVDSNASLQDTKALGLNIGSSSALLEKGANGAHVIIISSGHYNLEIEKECLESGLKKNIDYVMCSDLNDVDPSVDISGVCNLKCISCPRGNISEQPPVGFITAKSYKLVLDKLLRELPFLGNMQFYAWGEPLLNKELPQIVEMTKDAGVLSALSSNLNATKGYEALVKAKLDWLKISCSGFSPETYELTHTGGKWKRFFKNLNQIVELREKYHPEMSITLNYHLYKHNVGVDYKKMEEFCQNNGLIFRPSPAYLYPMDTMRDYVDGNPLSCEATQTKDLLLMDLDQGLAKAREQKHLPCPEDRCLPIDWDLKVRFCGVYFKPYIADNFLNVSVEDIMNKRFESDFCSECMDRGLHQFTGVYLPQQTIPSENIE